MVPKETALKWKEQRGCWVTYTAKSGLVITAFLEENRSLGQVSARESGAVPTKD